MTKVLSFRVSDEEAEWADQYASSRGVSRGDLLAEGFRSFREDCVRGVPEIREEKATYREKVQAVKSQGPSDLTASRLQIAREMGWRS